MLEFMTSVDFWKFAAPLFGAIIAWFVNEWRKRIWHQYQKKEESYRELLHCIRGFYAESNNAKLKSEFLNQLNKCWLYCPDDIILKGYAFLDTMHIDNHSSNDEVRERAMGDFISSIRNDILSRKLVKRTRLSGKDFKHLKIN